ncbi:alpha,alpha-trehalase TreF [Neolewinella antarctica]|uniref:Alpha,alpha-trehalase n=1 Tax=Neolewinella antarctica TaxID=442734 RepID=A0ABX0XC28_9BACT|nr:alpha,alpha-trehalase TreF [Neolewinella antarctica]NJC26814.1 alpha,alpha-trehalase [Neolewinella antarctica]
MPKISLFILLFVLSLASCRTDPAPTSPALALPIAIGTAPTSTRERQAPDELFGELFRRVQMEQVYPDGKTFVDMAPQANAAEIMDAYATEKVKPGFNLKAFTEQHFAPPVQPESGFASDGNRTITEHINTLWPVLTRRAGTDEGAAGSLIPLPEDYIVPGGRFREIYYWDSYFTLLGLQAAGKNELVRAMVENFAYLIDEVGHVPNGNRTYYLTRSQPPFFVFMVEVLAEIEGAQVYREFYPQLAAEYAYWMDGLEELTEVNPANNHVVRLPDGSILNRYYAAGDRPRAESYREDVLTIRESGRDSQTVARHLRSGAESGWDYSARWFADGETIGTIRTTDILPPDLNSLLYKLELVLEERGTDVDAEYAGKAEQRRRAINEHLYDETTGFYQDVYWPAITGEGINKEDDASKFTGYLTLAGVYPLFVGLAEEAAAASVGELIADRFLAPGGVRTSLVDTDQQWDAPNGWAPLQWMTYRGLKNYGEDTTAEQIRLRWMANNERVYENVNKLVEKYNVEDITLEAGGGEYPVQDGFGWSNGVYLKMADEAR